MFQSNYRHQWFNRFVSGVTSFLFIFSLSIPPQSFAQVVNSVEGLPVPGTMVTLSPAFSPVILKGVQIHPDNPLKFDFIIDRGDSKLENEALKIETQTLIKYFLAGMTIPEEDLWVNLNPYEQDKITNNNLGVTEMGRELLAQDYLLKQLSASLIYPEKDLGKTFWDKVYKKTYELFGRTDVPVNTFNKVWIVPDKAVVYEEGDTAFVMESHMKVMLEEDYLALDNNLKDKGLSKEKIKDDQAKKLNGVSSAIVREVVLPEIEKEVNEGKNFAHLRQIYNSLILAAWFKKSLKDSLLGKIYVDKSKVAGVDVDDRAIKDKIYNQYMQAYKKGVYDYIKEDYDPAVKKAVPRNYFSGGFSAINIGRQIINPQFSSPEQRTAARQAVSVKPENAFRATVNLSLHSSEAPQNLSTQPLIEIVKIKDQFFALQGLNRVQAERLLGGINQDQLGSIHSVEVIPNGTLPNSNRSVMLGNKLLIEAGNVGNGNLGRVSTSIDQSSLTKAENLNAFQLKEIQTAAGPRFVSGPEMTEQDFARLTTAINQQPEKFEKVIQIADINEPVAVSPNGKFDVKETVIPLNFVRGLQSLPDKPIKNISGTREIVTAELAKLNTVDNASLAQIKQAQELPLVDIRPLQIGEAKETKYVALEGVSEREAVQILQGIKNPEQRDRINAIARVPSSEIATPSELRGGRLILQDTHPIETPLGKIPEVQQKERPSVQIVKVKDQFVALQGLNREQAEHLLGRIDQSQLGNIHSIEIVSELPSQSVLLGNRLLVKTESVGNGNLGRIPTRIPSSFESRRIDISPIRQIETKEGLKLVVGQPENLTQENLKRLAELPFDGNVIRVANISGNKALAVSRNGDFDVKKEILVPINVANGKAPLSKDIENLSGTSDVEKKLAELSNIDNASLTGQRQVLAAQAQPIVEIRELEIVPGKEKRFVALEGLSPKEAVQILQGINPEQRARINSIAKVSASEIPTPSELRGSKLLVQDLHSAEIPLVRVPELTESSRISLNEAPAGIDLNTKKLLDLQTSGKGITPFNFKDVNVDVDQLQKNGFDGFVPVIENLVPIQNFQLLFGQNNSSSSESSTDQKLSVNK